MKSKSSKPNILYLRQSTEKTLLINRFTASCTFPLCITKILLHNEKFRSRDQICIVKMYPLIWQLASATPFNFIAIKVIMDSRLVGNFTGREALCVHNCFSPIKWHWKYLQHASSLVNIRSHDLEAVIDAWRFVSICSTTFWFLMGTLTTFLPGQFWQYSYM